MTKNKSRNLTADYFNNLNVFPIGCGLFLLFQRACFCFGKLPHDRHGSWVAVCCRGMLLRHAGQNRSADGKTRWGVSAFFSLYT